MDEIEFDPGPALADLVRREKAKAWDEGYDAGMSYVTVGNPYREDDDG